MSNDRTFFVVPLLGAVGVALAVGAVCAKPAGAARANADPVGALHAAAQNNGVPAGPLLRVAFCESRFDPLARGDHGSSHGLVQLSDLPTGLLRHFRSVGYSDPYDAEESADYLAKVYRGDFAREGVTVARWSCW